MSIHHLNWSPSGLTGHTELNRPFPQVSLQRIRPRAVSRANYSHVNRHKESLDLRTGPTSDFEEDVLGLTWALNGNIKARILH